MSGRAYLGWILRQCACGRFRQALHRRRYSVSMPNSLWHIEFGYLPSSGRFLNMKEFSECYNVSEERIYIIATKLPVHYPGYFLSRRLRYLQFLSQHALGRLLHLLTPFVASMGYGFMLHGPMGLHNSMEPEGLYIYTVQVAKYHSNVM